MQVTGPFPITSGTQILTETQPSSFQQAVAVENNSPYQLTLYIANKQYTLAPYMKDLFLKPTNIQSITFDASELSGVIPSGSNSDLVLIWYGPNDTVDQQMANFPVALSPISVSSGSTITGNVEITAPLAANGSVNVEVTTPVSAEITAPLAANGSVNVEVTTPVSAEITAPLAANGSVEIETTPAATATITAVASSAASVAVVASNAARRGLILSNNSTEPVLVAFAAAASATAFTVVLAIGQNFVLPAPVYTGAISAIWPTAGTGDLSATELS